MAATGAARRVSWWRRMVAIGVAVVAGAATATATATATSGVAYAATTRPTLRMVVEPQHPIVGTQAEIVAQVVPSSLGRSGRLTTTVVDPSGRVRSVVLSRVEGTTPGTWGGLVPVPVVGVWRVQLRYEGGGVALSAARTFTVVKGSPFAHDLSLIVVVVVLGGAWYLMRRRR
jgi:hypothetical protein